MAKPPALQMIASWWPDSEGFAASLTAVKSPFSAEACSLTILSQNAAVPAFISAIQLSLGGVCWAWTSTAEALAAQSAVSAMRNAECRMQNDEWRKVMLAGPSFRKEAKSLDPGNGVEADGVGGLIRGPYVRNPCERAAPFDDDLGVR